MAEALRGPVRVLAGAGTGKTRAITHRIAYGVATGAYNPTEVLAVTFTTRAAGEMRTRLRALGAPGVQARTFHSAALRQLRYFWPQVYGGELPDADRVQDRRCVARAARRNGSAPTRRRCATSPPRSSGPRSATSAPTTTPRLAPGRGREVTGARRRHGGARLRRLRGASSASRAGWTWRTSCSSAPALLAEDERVAAAGPPAVQVVRRRRVPGRHPDPGGAARPVAGRSRRDLRGRRPGADDLLVRRCRAAYLTRVPAQASRRATSVELVRNYRSTPEVVAAANALLAGHAARGRRRCAPSSPSGPTVASPSTPDEVAEAEAVADRDRRAARRRARPLREIAVLFRINAQSEALRGGAGRPRRPVRRPRRRPLLRAPRGPPGADPAARAAARVGRGRRRRPRRAGARRARAAWAGPPRRPPAAARPATAGSRCSSGRPGRGVRRRDAGADLGGFVDELDRRAAEQHAPVAEGVTLATLHAAKGLEWDAVFLAGCRTARCRSPTPTTPAAVEEERRLLYVGITRARERLTLSWSLARNPGGRAAPQAVALPRPGCCPESAADAPAAGAAAEARRAQGPQLPECRPARWRRPRERNLRPLRDCPAPYDEELFDSLKEWRMQRADAESVPAFVVFSDATLERSPRSGPVTGKRPARHQRHRRRQARAYADDVLAGRCPARSVETLATDRKYA